MAMSSSLRHSRLGMVVPGSESLEAAALSPEQLEAQLIMVNQQMRNLLVY